jgi:hypothetical protein
MSGTFIVMQNYVLIFIMLYWAASNVHGHGVEESVFDFEVFVYDSNQ